MKNQLTKVRKRDGSIVDFDIQRITNAVYKAMQATGEGSLEAAQKISAQIEQELAAIRVHHKTFIPTVEGIQDAVEKALIVNQLVQTAKSYILYREKRAEMRRSQIEIPADFIKLAEESKQYFRNPLSEFVYLRTYARWSEEHNRRETWIETVDRYLDFMHEKLGDAFNKEEYTDLRTAILKQEIMPSMRLLQFAGKAARATNVCAYNCSFIAPCCFQDFAEVMYISMCGTGVGFSVESANIQQLPIVKRQTGKVAATHIITDSKEGWCDALTLGLQTWFGGEDVKFDYSQLRAAGMRLKTMGGKSSGPDPLRSLLDFTRDKVLKRQGRRLSNLDAHDILCKIGEVVVSGGVRRSAMISLSDLDDTDLRDAKKGLFYYTDPQRSMANNSAVYNDRPTNQELLQEWLALIQSRSGERGIFNRGGLIKTLPERRLQLFKELGVINQDRITGIIGTNPCGEIILRSKSFCNLTEIIARAEDDLPSLKRKIRLATILGTYQATLTKFPYLSKDWQKNCEMERLLGVSLTGQWDSPVSRDAEALRALRQEALDTNKVYAQRLNINPSYAITCVKPSGTASLVVDCASGMHQRFAPYYIRRIRISATDSLFKMLKNQGVPYFPEVGQAADNANTFVLEFPVKAPDKAIFRKSMTAMEQLAHWKKVKENYTEHNPSVTITVGEDEWIAVLNWISENWDIVGGLSFLPRDDHVYRLAPYEEIDEQRYNELCQKFTKVDFSQLFLFEREDETETKRELACSGDNCEIA